MIVTGLLVLGLVVIGACALRPTRDVPPVNKSSMRALARRLDAEREQHPGRQS